MLALLAAAAVAAVQPLPRSGSERVILDDQVPVAAAVATPMPNIYRAPAHCGAQRYPVVDRHGRPMLLPLGSLPASSLQLTVDRRVDGCPVITVARGSVPPAADQPNPPASQYRVRPLQPGRR